MTGQKLAEVTSVECLEAILCKDGTCSAEAHIRITSAMAAMARLNRIWRCNTISFASKFKLYKSRATFILLYDCYTWILLADSEKWPRFSKSSASETSPHLLLGTQAQRLGAEQDQLLCWSTGTYYSNCQETETCMARARHTRRPLQNHL